MRSRKTTVECELRDLKRFLEVYKDYAPILQNKIDHLEGFGDKGTTVYTRYFGQTIEGTPLTRMGEDKNLMSNMSLFRTWYLRFDGGLVAHEFVDLRTTLEIRAGRHSQYTWLTRPDLQNLEYLVALAGGLGAMNSATGGMPQVQHAIPQVRIASSGHICP